MIENQKAVFISVLNQGEIAVELAQCLDNIIVSSPYPIFIEYSCEKPISYNRNQIVKRFLERPQYDYLIMIDSDIVPPPNYMQLVDFQKDIISGLCFAYTKQSIFPLVCKKEKRRNKGRKYFAYRSVDPKDWTGLLEVDAVGTGAIILSRKVLEAIPYPFRNEYDKTGEKEIGLDLNFCRRAKDLGFQVFCHTDYKCSHHTRMDLFTLYRTMRDAYKKVEDLDYKNKRLVKQNETLTRKLNHGKNIKKDKTKSAGIEDNSNPVGDRVNSILNAEGKDVQKGGSEILPGESQKNVISEVTKESYKKEFAQDNGASNPDATSQTPSEAPTGNS